MSKDVPPHTIFPTLQPGHHTASTDNAFRAQTSIGGDRGDLQRVGVAGGDGLLLVLCHHLNGLTHIWEFTDDQVVLLWAAAH